MKWASGLQVMERSEQVFESWSSFLLWQTGVGHTGSCHGRPPQGAALFSPIQGPRTTQTPLEPVLGAGGWELKAKQKPSLWCSFCARESSLSRGCNLHITTGRAAEVLRTKEAQSAPPSLLCETSIRTRLRTSLKPELFRSEVLLWVPLSVDFFLHLDCLGQH